MFRGSIRGGGGRVWNIKSGGNIYIVCQRAITAVPRQERPAPAQPRPSTSWRLITELGWDGGLFARLVFAKCRECRDVHHKQTEPIPKSSISSVSFLCWAWQKLFHGLALYLSLVLAKCFCIVVTSLSISLTLFSGVRDWCLYCLVCLSYCYSPNHHYLQENENITTYIV